MANEKKELLFKVENLQKYFPVKKKHIFQKRREYVRANKDISLEIYKGETLGLVGESGCGKSTFGRTLIQLYEATGGSALYYGVTIEEFMPSYVKKTFKSLKKNFSTYEEDLKKLEDLEEQYRNTPSGEDTDIFDDYTFARNAFIEKHQNAIRLAGGLLVHDDLDEVSTVLLEQYSKQAKYAQILKKKHDLEVQYDVILDDEKRQEIAAKIAQVEEELTKEKPIVAEVTNRVESLRNECRDKEAFEEFENQRDNGLDLTSLTEKEMRRLRQDLQIIFQDPYSSLDPRFTVGRIIGEGLLAHKIFEDSKSDAYNNYIIDVMEKCGLKAEFIHRYPHQFSGGQRQRIGIARALAMNPEFVVADEAVSALDVSIQAQVLKLLQDLKEENDLTYLFITHDLGVVKYISDRIGVMYFGHLVELAPADEIFTNPQHPYTKALLDAIPRTDESRQVQAELDEYYRKQRGDVNYDDIFEFGFLETGEVDKDWYEVSPGHFVACRLKQ